MSADPLAVFCFGVQALRRRIERLRCPLGGALGVRAQLLPHQVGSVHRVLTDLRVRHLLADEVGLGKTVQVLMAINALQLQRGDAGFRVLIIVPDDLKVQWRDELVARGHKAPIEQPPDEDGERFVRLAWESQLKSITQVDPTVYDLLVVDELHRLKSTLQKHIVQRSSDFAAVLILTATPRLQEARRRAQLLQMLEPARSQRGAMRVGQGESEGEAMLAALESREALASALLSQTDGADWSTLGGAPPPDGQARVAALAHCMYRRVVRTHREDWGGLLPRRAHHQIFIEPTEAEVQRQRLIWRYIGNLGDLSSDVDPERLAIRALVGAETLRLRIVQLRQQNLDPDGLLVEAANLLGADHGDSRLDALTDLLMQIWATNPHERVLIAAQDNVTIDYLRERLSRRFPFAGPLRNRATLKIAELRAFGEVGASISKAGDTSRNVELFTRGEAQLLLAADVAQVGLNLQCSRVLVLYGVPWNPQEVEQWIGRLDRIGNRAVLERAKGNRSIDIYTIVQRGQIDERVVEVLRAYGVFTRGINLDGKHIAEVHDKIRRAGLHQALGSWRSLRDDAQSFGESDREDYQASPLQGALPWGRERALKLYQRCTDRSALQPCVAMSNRDVSETEALEAWLRALKNVDEYDCRRAGARGSRYWTLWYRFEFSTKKRKPVLSQVTLGDGVANEPHVDSRARNRAAFISRRDDIEQPPRSVVILEPDNIPRALQFLNHGGSLHEALVDGWEQYAREKTPPGLSLELPTDHVFFTEQSPGTIALVVGWLDAADNLGPFEPHAIAEHASESTPRSRKKIIDAAARHLRAAWEADVRWIRAILPAQLTILGCRIEPDGTQGGSLDPVVTYALLRVADRSPHTPFRGVWPLSEQFQRVWTNAREYLIREAAEAARISWAGPLAALKSELSERRYLCAVESYDSNRLAVLQREHAEARSNAGQERSARDQERVVAAVGRARLGWLEGLLKRAAEPRIQEYRTLLLNIARA